MHLLTQSTAPDYPAWKAAFDTHAEATAAAGLTVLQIWRGENAAVLVLFEVADRARAERWLRDQSARGGTITAQFLQTA